MFLGVLYLVEERVGQIIGGSSVSLPKGDESSDVSRVEWLSVGLSNVIGYS